MPLEDASSVGAAFPILHHVYRFFGKVLVDRGEGVLR
jgi:hypothetical protein